MGYTEEQLKTVGTAIPVEKVDAIEENILNDRIEDVRTKVQGLDLENYQIYALVSRSYNMGKTGWYEGYTGTNFYDAYTQYFNPETDIKYGEKDKVDYENDFYTHFMYDTQYSSGQWSSGLENRRKSEWLLFQTGYISTLGIYVSESSGSVNPDGLSWPCKEGTTITSSFGTRADNHGGTDFKLVIGSEIYAAHDGIVTYVANGYDNNGYYGFGGKTMASYGNCVMIEYNNGKFCTLYAHCTEVLVKEGEHVSQGQLIAKSGNSGSSDGPHLHFELQLNGVRVDSEPYINTNKLREEGYLDD